VGRFFWGKLYDVIIQAWSQAAVMGFFILLTASLSVTVVLPLQIALSRGKQ